MKICAKPLGKAKNSVDLWVLFLVVAVGLAGCSSQSSPRFTHTSPNQYIMFDNKTAQACWAGPVWQYSLKTIQTDLNDAARERGETPPPLSSNLLEGLFPPKS
jgi:hypothetical protein